MTDEFVTDRLYGNYRAKVVDNKDPEKFGRIRVWIPDLMPQISDVQGMWARPANNPMGGRNKFAQAPKKPRQTRGDSIIETLEYQKELYEYQKSNPQFYTGSSYIPAINSWIWVFFEAGNINRPYYFGSLDIENAKVLAENQAGDDYERKWTIFKSNQGRAIVVSDDPGDQRVEITGEKQQLADPPSGDEYSVYAITGNQNTILIDERYEQEKILIKTYKGDFINLNIEDQSLEIQVSGDIHIKNGGNLFVTSAGDMHFLSGKSIHMTAKDEINISSGHRMNIESGEEYNRKVLSNSVEQVGGMKITEVAGRMHLETGGQQDIIAGGNINTDANPNINDNSGLAEQPPEVNIETIIATQAEPEGERDT